MTEPAPERWAYTGVRLAATHKLVEQWQPVDDDGQPVGDSLWYASKRGSTAAHAVGSIYTAHVVRTDDRTTRHGEPGYTADRVSDALRAAWWTEQHTARTRYAIVRDEANAAKVDALNEALEPLLVLARAARTGVQRDALIATVLRRLAQA